MSDLPESLAGFDWRVATWEGSRREQLRRWSGLPLDQIISALEEMEEFQRRLASHVPEKDRPKPR